ncbi:MAG: hypothetical protein ABSC88_12930 [Terracidiphilus sp.]|jgi:hypothetical protein
MKRRFAGLAAIALLTVCGVTAQAPAPPPAQTTAQAAASTPAKADPWAALRFLLGSWEAKTTDGMAQAAAAYSFRLELRDHLLARHSRSGACAAPEDFDCQHNDLLYIYPAANDKRCRPSTSTTRATSFTMTSPRLSPEPWFSSPILRNLGRNTG